MIAGVLLASLHLTVPLSAHAATAGSDAWYWPVGTENFRGWDGFWAYRPQHPPRWHVAQDMPVPVGHAVYAVGDGVVLEAGGDHHYGGVIVVLHTTADGHLFKAVYGHMRPSAGIRKGVKVRAGQVVGRVNGAAHLHFGIHPGRAYPPDRNPYRGHTYNSKVTYGWVDPVKYLRSNPRILPYTAPRLPSVATVETPKRATVLGTLDGTVYWTTGSETDTTTYARGLSEDGAGTPVDAVPPTLDTARYASQVATTSFVLSDRLPVLTLTLSTLVPAANHSVTLSGRLANASGTAFSGARVIVETSPDGATWTQACVALCGLTGAYSTCLTPTGRAGVRARFVPPSTYLPACSAVATVTPFPALP